MVIQTKAQSRKKWDHLQMTRIDIIKQLKAKYFYINNLIPFFKLDPMYSYLKALKGSTI